MFFLFIAFICNLGIWFLDFGFFSSQLIQKPVLVPMVAGFLSLLLSLGMFLATFICRCFANKIFLYLRWIWSYSGSELFVLFQFSFVTLVFQLSAAILQLFVAILQFFSTISNYLKLFEVICSYLRLFAAICGYLQLFAAICSQHQGNGAVSKVDGKFAGGSHTWKVATILLILC